MRNKVPTNKYISYKLPGSDIVYTCRPSPSSKLKDETEDQWLQRTENKYIPKEAINIEIKSD